jgi:hypothetical protein
MGRARHNVFAPSNSQLYVVTWDLQWRIVDCLRPPPGSDPHAAFADAIARLERGGWTAQSGAEFGFSFLTRAAERRLVTITGRDPFNCAAQSFSPFSEPV